MHILVYISNPTYSKFKTENLNALLYAAIMSILKSKKKKQQKNIHKK